MSRWTRMDTYVVIAWMGLTALCLAAGMVSADGFGKGWLIGQGLFLAAILCVETIKHLRRPTPKGTDGEGT